MEKGIFNNFYQYLIEEFESGRTKTLKEPDLLQNQRNNAFEVFKKSGFPSVKNEDWKYTSLSRFINTVFTFQPETAKAACSATTETSLQAMDAYKVVLVNGVLQTGISDTLPDNIKFLDAEAAFADTDFQKSFSSAAAADADAMVALNAAFYTNVLFLHIPAKAVLDKPLHICHNFTAESPVFVPFRTLIVAGELSEATVVETFDSSLSTVPVFISYVSEQFLGENAILKTYLLNNLNANGHLVHHREIIQQRNSNVSNINVSFPGSPFIRNDINVRMAGINSESHLYGLYLTSNNQLVDNHTIADHQVPNCNSNEWYKGILLDSSHAVFNGKVFVRPDAQKTNAFQENNNLLLSDNATIDSKPQLEIFADDVKCSHGSTVGKMDKEAFFYLRSRGIGEETANKLLIEAFAYDVLAKIEIESVLEYTKQLLHQYLDIPEPAVIESDLETNTAS